MKTAGKNHAHTNVKSWLYTIARNTLIDELRQQSKWKFQELQEDLIQTNNLSKEFEQADKLAKFNEAVTCLPFHQREAFIFQQEGFSVLEISQLTGESFETVKSRLRYARNNLKTLLGSNS
jgi:RNA polymerase sigma-70 factor (ECF subfamily)